MDRETEEAIRAGESAIRSLREAQVYLDKASTWGIVDIIGGGLFTNIMKHSRLSNAGRAIEDARQRLRVFSRELEDVDERLPGIDIGGFLSFADFFFDGFIADMFVQSRISEAKEQVAYAIRQVDDILIRLRRLRLN